MKILLALFLPPVAAFLYGGLGTAILNVLLCCLAVVPGIVHAIYVVTQYDADKRIDRLAAAMGKAQQR